MTAPRALALSDKQLALLQRGAASLPVGERDHFLRSVAARLTGAPTDDALIAAITAALDAAAWRGKREEKASMSMSHSSSAARFKAALASALPTHQSALG